MATAPLTGKPTTTKYIFQLGGVYGNTVLYGPVPTNTLAIMYQSSVVPAGTLSFSILAIVPTGGTALTMTTSNGITYSATNNARAVTGSTAFSGGIYMYPGEYLVANGDAGGNATSGIVFYMFELSGQS